MFGSKDDKGQFLSLIDLDEKDRKLLLAYISDKKGINIKPLEEVLKDNLLLLLDLLAGKTIRIPNKSNLYKQISYIKAYRYIKGRGFKEDTIDKAMKIFGLSRPKINKIIDYYRGVDNIEK